MKFFSEGCLYFWRDLRIHLAPRIRASWSQCDDEKRDEADQKKQNDAESKSAKNEREHHNRLQIAGYRLQEKFLKKNDIGVDSVISLFLGQTI